MAEGEGHRPTVPGIGERARKWINSVLQPFGYRETAKPLQTSEERPRGMTMPVPERKPVLPTAKPSDSARSTDSGQASSPQEPKPEVYDWDSEK